MILSVSSRLLILIISPTITGGSCQSLTMWQPRTLAEQRAMRQSLAVLASYYSSWEWKKDFAADEAGLLPKSLKHGILSEDGLWNLLSGY